MLIENFSEVMDRVGNSVKERMIDTLLENESYMTGNLARSIEVIANDEGFTIEMLFYGKYVDLKEEELPVIKKELKNLQSHGAPGGLRPVEMRIIHHDRVVIVKQSRDFPFQAQDDLEFRIAWHSEAILL